MIMNQPVQADDGSGIAFLGLVLGDQRGQGFLGLGGQNFPGACQSDFFNRAAGLAGVPGIEGGELADQRVPIRLGQNRPRAEQRRDGVGLQRGNRTGPGRIDALGQRQRRRGADLRQRQAGNVA